MQTEVEAKFLDIDHDEIRKKLVSIGAVCEKPMRLMRRVIIDNDFMKDGKDAFLRVRDEGDRVVMTYKQFDELSVDGAKEIEVIVNSFDDTVLLLAQIGMPYNSFQESKRETWKHGDVEVVLDEWPWLKPYIEIEGPSEVSLKEVVNKLGLDWSSAVFGDVMAAYRAQYSHLSLTDTVGTISVVKFNDPLPALFKPTRIDKDLQT